MEKSEIFLKQFNSGAYTVIVQGKENLTVKIVKDNCPRLNFSGDLSLLNPHNSDYKEFFSSKPELLCSNVDGILILSVSGSRDLTPILRVPLEILDAIVDKLSDYLELIPETFLSDLEINLSQKILKLRVAEISIRGEHVKEVVYSFNMSQALASWVFFKNLGVRSSEAQESQFIADLTATIMSAVSKQEVIWQAEVKRKKLREAHIPSEDDKPVYRFCEYVNDYLYACAVDSAGNFLHYSVGTSIVRLAENEREKVRNHRITAMENEIKLNHWQYKIIIAKENDPEIISFLEEFFKKPISNERATSYLFRIYCKWTKQAIQPQLGSGWKIIAH